MVNYPQLQHLIKQDPASYKVDFVQQLEHLRSLYEIVKLTPQDPQPSFCDLIMFIAHVSHCFPKECAQVSSDLLSILHDFGTILESSIRSDVIKSLFLLKRKGLIDSFQLISQLFHLFKCQDKLLREQLYSFIFNDIKNINLHAKNLKINRSVQRFIYGLIEGDVKSEGLVIRYALRLLVELFGRRIWNDGRTANIIAKCCHLKDSKSAVIALKFFTLSGQQDGQDDSSDESDDPEKSYKSLVRSSHFSGKSKRSKIKRVLEKLKKRSLGKAAPSGMPSFHAIELLNDPLLFAERLFQSLKSSADRFKVKLLMVNVLTSVIAVHKLLLPDIYQFLTRYINPNQRDVTQILAYSAQCCHEQVPAQEIEVILRAIADGFVADHCSSEVIVVGMNAIREVVKRSPGAMTDTLLQDLAQYKTYKDKGVMMATRSLISLFRTVNPLLLHRRDRGKEASAAARHPQPSGHGVATGIEGAEFIKRGGKNSKLPVEATRILTDEDFRRIAKLKRWRELKAEMDGGGSDVPDMEEEVPSGTEESDDEEENVLGLVNEKTIAYQPKRRKSSYEDRVASVEEGRKGRHQFKSKKGNEDRGSTTNEEKAKRKNFLMILNKRSVRHKARQSLSQKRQALVARAKGRKLCK